MEIKQGPEIRELNDKTVAFVSFIGNYMGKPEIFAGLFEKLCGWAGPKGLIRKDSIFLASYKDDPHTTPPEEMSLEICLTVPENTEVEGEIKKQKLPGGKYIVMNVELVGPQEYGEAWNKIVEWMKENKLEVDMSRPSYEIYLNDPNKHPEGHHILDICMSSK